MDLDATENDGAAAFKKVPVDHDAGDHVIEADAAAPL